MSRYVGRHEYALCSYHDSDGRRCKAFILPEPSDPSGPGAVLVGYLDVTNALLDAGWDTGEGGDWCPDHKDQAAAARAESAAALEQLTANLTGKR